MFWSKESFEIINLESLRSMGPSFIDPVGKQTPKESPASLPYTHSSVAFYLIHSATLIRTLSPMSFPKMSLTILKFLMSK